MLFFPMPFPQEAKSKANSILTIDRNLNIQTTLVFSFLQQATFPLPWISLDISMDATKDLQLPSKKR